MNCECDHKWCFVLHSLVGYYSNDQLTKVVELSVWLLQINVEGMSRSKREYLSRLPRESSADVVSLQETHIADEAQLNTRAYVDGCRIAIFSLTRVNGSINRSEYSAEPLNLGNGIEAPQ